jgi:hypothetical protein
VGFGGIASHVSGLSARRPAREGVGAVLGSHRWLGCRCFLRAMRNGRPAPSPRVCSEGVLLARRGQIRCLFKPALAPTCAREMLHPISHPTLVHLKPRLAGFPQGQGQGERQRGTPARSSWLPDVRSVPAAPTYAAMGDVARAGGVRILVGLSSGLSEGLAPEQLPRV